MTTYKRYYPPTRLIGGVAAATVLGSLMAKCLVEKRKTRQKAAQANR